MNTQQRLDLIASSLAEYEEIEVRHHYSVHAHTRIATYIIRQGRVTLEGDRWWRRGDLPANFMNTYRERVMKINCEDPEAA